MEEARSEAASQREDDDDSDAKIRSLMAEIGKSGGDIDGINR